METPDVHAPLSGCRFWGDYWGNICPHNLLTLCTPSPWPVSLALPAQHSCKHANLRVELVGRSRAPRDNQTEGQTMFFGSSGGTLGTLACSGQHCAKHNGLDQCFDDSSRQTGCGLVRDRTGDNIFTAALTNSYLARNIYMQYHFKCPTVVCACSVLE